MPRAIWTGNVSFGLVSIPVKMVTAVKPKELSFHLLHKKDNARVRQKLVCPAEHGKEVPREDTVKGFEISPERMVVIDPEELKELSPKAERSIDILDFVPLSSIDSIYFNQPYFLLPDERAAKPYRLLYEALEHSKRVAVAKFVMRAKQYLSALRPLDGVICLETMYYADELVTKDELEGTAADAKVSPRELQMAEQLIASLSTTFKAAKYKDDYREKVRDLIEKKAEGKHVVAQAPQVEGKPQIIDLMSALKASLEETRRPQSSPKKKRRVA